MRLGGGIRPRRVANVSEDDVETVERGEPEAAGVVEPQAGGVHRLLPQAEAVRATAPPTLDEARTLEHREVLGDGGLADREGRPDLAGGRLAARESPHDRAARRIGERAEGVVESGQMHSHMVIYWRFPPRRQGRVGVDRTIVACPAATRFAGRPKKSPADAPPELQTRVRVADERRMLLTPCTAGVDHADGSFPGVLAGIDRDPGIADARRLGRRTLAVWARDALRRRATGRDRPGVRFVAGAPAMPGRGAPIDGVAVHD